LADVPERDTIYFMGENTPNEKRSGSGPVFSVSAVRDGPALESVRTLIREYLAFLDADLSFQDIEAELRNLPGKYAPPSGTLLLASVHGDPALGKPAGCGALRDLGGGYCEMKRLFVCPEFRGYGVGRVLAERLLAEGRALGYRAMRLDTLDRLGEAVALYRALGFRMIPPYCENPLPGAMFWEREL